MLSTLSGHPYLSGDPSTMRVGKPEISVVLHMEISLKNYETPHSKYHAPNSMLPTLHSKYHAQSNMQDYEL